MTFQKKLAAGVQNAWLWFVDSDGFAIGNDTTALSNGTIRPSYQFRGIQSMPSGVPEAEAVAIPGDDTTLGTIIFPSDAPREFLMNFGEGDQGLAALLQRTLVETMNNISLGLVDPANPDYPTVGLLVQSRSIKRENTLGQAAWSGYLYPSVQIQPLYREQFQGRTAAVWRYKGVAQQSMYKPWAVTVSDTVNGDTSALVFDLDSPYPMTLDAFKLPGTPSPSFTLNKTPVNTTETLAFVERVSAAVTSVSTTTKAMVLTATGVAGQRGVVLYGYQ